MKNFVIIDGNALIHRGFYAIPRMTMKSGEVINGVYGFVSMLVNILDKIKPACIVAAFDVKGPTLRHKAFDGYKATRIKAPDELYMQIPRIREVCDAFNIPSFGIEGFEADDVIGTIVQKLKKNPEFEVYIVTGDMDALQLINHNVFVFAPHKGFSETKTYDEAAVKEKYGLNVSQLVDYKALRGDTSDNIPGVKGIGEKTAIKLLQEFGTLDGVYNNLDKIKGKTRECLIQGKDSAIMSKQLGKIITDVEIDFNLEKCETKNFVKEKIRKILEELEFFSIIKRLIKIGILNESAKKIDKNQLSLF